MKTKEKGSFALAYECSALLVGIMAVADAPRCATSKRAAVPPTTDTQVRTKQ